MQSNIKKIINFFNDEILYYGASLSFFTILALLPILALIMVLVSTLEIFDSHIDKFMLFTLDYINPTHSEQLVSTVSSFLSNASDLGVLGLVYLFFTFILFFRDYDHIVNKIYNIEERSFFNMFFVYMLFILFLPLVFIFYTVLIATVTIAFIDNHLVNSLLTFLVNWLFLIFVFKISINQQVSFKAIAIATFIVIMALSTFKQIFIFYTIYNQMYTTIYGSFSVLMLFFIWLYISWMIYLYGIKLSKLLNEKLSIF